MLITTYTSFFFFFNDTATTEIYTLSLHDALPISGSSCERRQRSEARGRGGGRALTDPFPGEQPGRRPVELPGKGERERRRVAPMQGYSSPGLPPSLAFPRASPPAPSRGPG